MFDMDDLNDWAERVLDEEARLSAHLTDGDLQDRAVIERAEFFTLADGWWLIAHPDDPRLREYLLNDGSMPPALADAVLAKMRELGHARGHAPGL